MQIYEAEGKTAVIAFGRMNPPTIGHAKLADKIASLPGDPYIFLSHSQKPKTDPLSFEQKAGYAKAFFPNVTVGDPEVRTAIQAFSKISDMGYSNLIYVAGSDRVDDFQKLLSTYNGQPDKEGNVAYNFDNIKVVSAGARDPDAEGAEGMSASKMRAAAASGDFESFKSGTPDPKLAQAMYRDVRNGLGMMESLARIIEVATMLKSLDEVKPITEDVKKAFGVVVEAWSEKYKRSINCNNPKGFSQRAHCAGRKKNEGVNEDATSSDLSSVYTPSIPEIAKKHNISLQQVVDQLKKGLAKESEHTKNFDVALEIAMDHVAEIPDYYDRIEDIEGPYVEPDPKGYQIAGESQLNERATDIVYHYTTIGPALNILKSGEFQLSSVAGSVEQDINPKGHNFFLSTARSKGGEYHSRVGDSAVMFVLNGRWFSDRYPVKPVDYWAGFSIAGRNKEAEDRIFSKDPTMPIDPVTSIHVLLKEQNPFASAKTRQFLIRAKTLGIPTYLYKDESAWRLQNTAKAVSVAQMKSELSGPETFRTGGSGSRWLLPWLEVIFGKTDADLGKKAKDLVRGFRYYHNPGDDHGLGNELSNARKPGNLDREDAVKILKFMRQNRMLTHKDLVNYLVDKWKVKDESINEAGVGRITKQNATKDAPIGSEFANVKKLGLGSGKPKELHAKARKNSDPNTLFNLGLAESKELNENQVSISQDVDGGSLEGYVVDTNMPNLSNYLSSQGADPTLAEKISQQFGRIGVIRNMYVDDDRRGEGIGSELMSNAIDSAYDNDAEAIILVADTGESNEFDLVNWYNNYGFEKIGDASGDPIMLLAETKLQERGSISVPFASGTSVTIAPHRPLKVRKSKKKVKMVGAGGEE
jgi:GNAT superfamily N-acetyltransferase